MTLWDCLNQEPGGMDKGMIFILLVGRSACSFWDSPFVCFFKYNAFQNQPARRPTKK